MAKNLGDLKKWSDVQDFFTEAESRRFQTDDIEEWENLNSMKRFRMYASWDAPGYDLDQHSVQRAAVDWYNEHRSYHSASLTLEQENDKRLMMGFRTACKTLLGTNWEKESNFSRREEDWIAAKNYQMNAAFREEENPHLNVTVVKPDIPPLAQQVVTRHWTNPHFPLWLMANEALSQSVRYLAGSGFLTSTSVNTTIDRLGLKRLRDRPIRAIEFNLTEPRSFRKFVFVSYLRESLEAINVAHKGLEEVRRWRLDGRHFLRS